MDSQHIKVSETLLKSSPQYFSRIFLSISKIFRSKFCFSSIWNLDTVCLLIDTRWRVISLSKCKCFAQPIQMQLSTNQKIFAKIFFCITRIYMKFWDIWKERWTSEEISFWNFRLRKAQFLKCLKRPVSGHLWKVNMLKCMKHWPNFYNRTFVIFFWTLWEEISTKNCV